MIEFLQGFVASDLAHVAAAAAAVGVAVWAIIAMLEKLVSEDGQSAGIPPVVKFYGAMALAFLLPTAAYVGLQLATHQALQFEGFFLAGAVGYVVSQGIHWQAAGK